MIGVYEEFHALKTAKNKANSKLNKANVERSKIDFTYNTEDCHGPSGLAMTTRAAGFTQYGLKKQSQC